MTVFTGAASGPSRTGVIGFGAATLGGVTAHASFGDPILHWSAGAAGRAGCARPPPSAA